MWLVKGLLVLSPFLHGETVPTKSEIKSVLAEGQREEKVFVHVGSSDKMVPTLRKLSSTSIDYLAANPRFLSLALTPEAKNTSLPIPQPLDQEQSAVKKITLTRFRTEFLPYFSADKLRRLQFLLRRAN